MFKGQTVAVVITAYNEEGFVGEVIETLPSFVDRAYVVDDASTDGTWAEIQSHAVALDGGRLRSSTGEDDHGNVSIASDDDSGDGPDVVSIRHETNKGVGAAVKTGYRRAYDDEIDVVALMDGDGQMDPAILDRIIDPVVEGRADYAKGNRLLSREHTDGMSSWRRFGNRTLTFLTKIASGYWKTMDPQNGYTAISRRAIGDLDLGSLYDRYGFLNDLLVTLNAHSMRVADVEMQAVYADETSSINYSSFIPKVSGLLLRGFLWRMKTRYLVYDFHPLVILYLVGVAGGVSVAGQVALLFAGVLSPAVTFAAAVPSFLVSAFAVTLAMTFDVMNNEHLEVQELVDPSHGYRQRERPAVLQVNEQND